MQRFTQVITRISPLAIASMMAIAVAAGNGQFAAQQVIGKLI